METADAIRVAIAPYVVRPGATGTTILEVHVGLRAVRIAAVETPTPTTLEAVMEAATAVGVAPPGLSRQEGTLLPAREPLEPATAA